MTTLEALIAARALIEKPEFWIKGTLARDERGNYVNPTDPRAIQFCAVGAVTRIDIRAYTALCRAVRDGGLHQLSGRERLSALNDDPTTTHAMVLGWFDKAIANAQET